MNTVQKKPKHRTILAPCTECDRMFKKLACSLQTRCPRHREGANERLARINKTLPYYLKMDLNSASDKRDW